MKANSPPLLLKKRLKIAPEKSGAFFLHLCSCSTKKAAAFFMRLPKMIRCCKLGYYRSYLLKLMICASLSFCHSFERKF